MIRAYQQARGQGRKRHVVLVPDAVHDANPPTAGKVGRRGLGVPSGADGEVDVEASRVALGPHTSAVMLTSFSTVGNFESCSLEIVHATHEAGAMGFDVVLPHLSVSTTQRDEGRFRIDDDRPDSIGRMRSRLSTVGRVGAIGREPASDGSGCVAGPSHDRFVYPFGSRTSRTPSPTRLSARTTMKMAAPGTIISRGANCM